MNLENLPLEIECIKGNFFVFNFIRFYVYLVLVYTYDYFN
jgi:hypothetical protein